MIAYLGLLIEKYKINLQVFLQYEWILKRHCYFLHFCYLTYH